MNMLATSQYQPRLSSIINVAPDRSVDQIAVFTSNQIIGGGNQSIQRETIDLIILKIVCSIYLIMSGNQTHSFSGNTGKDW